MNVNENRAVIIREDDYELLKPYFSRTQNALPEMSLAAELSRALVVKKNEFPANVVRINSKITIQEEENGNKRAFFIVMPEYANIKEDKISILSPIASALIGYKKGAVVDWKVPAGLKRFKIMEVTNEEDLE